MRETIVHRLDGYADITKDIRAAQKYGADFSAEKGAAAAIVKRLHPSRLRLRVSGIIHETPSTRTLRLTAANASGLPPFQAGQYISLFLEIGGIRTSRPYSISSSPSQTGHYDITVRRVDGGLVSAYLLDTVKSGDLLESSGPQGTFVHNPIIHSDEMLCIAGGSGITPFMSMIREICDRGLDRKIWLLYGSKTSDDIIFHDTLTRLTDTFSNIRYMPVVEAPGPDYDGQTGLITADLMGGILETAPKAAVFICGPQAMYDFCLPALVDLGTPAHRIRREMFGAPINVWQAPGWPPGTPPDTAVAIHIQGGDVIAAKAGEPLIAALERHQQNIPSLCRSGECSMCRVKILSGRVFQAAGARVRRADRQFGYVHACVSYPIEDLTILLD